MSDHEHCSYAINERVPVSGTFTFIDSNKTLGTALIIAMGVTYDIIIGTCHFHANYQFDIRPIVMGLA
jgi:hypothetical protein